MGSSSHLLQAFLCHTLRVEGSHQSFTSEIGIAGPLWLSNSPEPRSSYKERLYFTLSSHPNLNRAAFFLEHFSTPKYGSINPIALSNIKTSRGCCTHSIAFVTHPWGEGFSDSSTNTQRFICMKSVLKPRMGCICPRTSPSNLSILPLLSLKCWIGIIQFKSSVSPKEHCVHCPNQHHQQRLKFSTRVPPTSGTPAYTWDACVSPRAQPHTWR